MFVQLFDSVVYVLLVVLPNVYIVLKNWNRKCFWTSVVYISQNGLYCVYYCVFTCIL